MGYQPKVARSITLNVPGTLIIGQSPARWYNWTGAPITISQVAASVGVAPTGSSLIADINLNGATIFTTQSNRPSIAANALTSGLVVPLVRVIPVGSYISVDVDQIGSTGAGADLVVQVIF